MFTPKGSSSAKTSQPMANMACRFDERNKWVIDSGCTEHITPNSDLFHESIKTSCELPVTIPNGDSIVVKGKGACSLPNGITVQNVLYVPDFTCGLLSVR